MTELKPLSEHAIAELRHIAAKPLPRLAVNPGVSSRLLRGELVRVVDLPSPFKTHNGAKVEHLVITAAGLAELERQGGTSARQNLEAKKQAIREGRGFCCKVFLVHTSSGRDVDVGRGKHYRDKPKRARIW